MICFAWHGFPQYAARCVGAFVKATTERVVVVATRPHVPVEGMERVAGCEVIWIENDNDPRDIKTLCGEMPRALFVSGWGTLAFNRYRDDVRANGGRVIAASDNDFRLSLKEILRALRFRFLLKGKYDGFWVPGESGRRLMRFYGVPRQMVQSGLYSADSSLFSDGKPLVQREKKILFVGQLIVRKNIVPFARAFLKANIERDWKLEICGCGPLKDLIPSDSSILVHDFVQPEALASIYREARIFALPSLEEHWGVVVHEAALSGCVLLLSDRISAGLDFIGRSNGMTVDPLSEDSMAGGIRKAMQMSDADLRLAQSESLERAQQISCERFADTAREFVNT